MDDYVIVDKSFRARIIYEYTQGKHLYYNLVPEGSTEVIHAVEASRCEPCKDKT